MPNKIIFVVGNNLKNIYHECSIFLTLVWRPFTSISVIVNFYKATNINNSCSKVWAISCASFLILFIFLPIEHMFDAFIITSCLENENIIISLNDIFSNNIWITIDVMNILNLLNHFIIVNFEGTYTIISQIDHLHWSMIVFIYRIIWSLILKINYIKF